MFKITPNIYISLPPVKLEMLLSNWGIQDYFLFIIYTKI